MFGYGYKADALKWRKHEAEKRAKFLKGGASAEYHLHLKSGEMVCGTISLQNTYRDSCLLDAEYKEYPAKSRIKSYFAHMCDKINSSGDAIDGVFYMPHTIEKITLGKITVFDGETQ